MIQEQCKIRNSSLKHVAQTSVCGGKGLEEGEAVWVSGCMENNEERSI